MIFHAPATPPFGRTFARALVVWSTAVALPVTMLACGDNSMARGAWGFGGAPALTGNCADGSATALGVASHPDEGHTHLVNCSATHYGTVPPSSGPHYSNWPAYHTYGAPVPWGFLVHGLEHGAVVVVYNCPDGCAEEVASAQAWIDALPADTSCGGDRPRVLLAPDRTLDVRWAAAAWGWTLRECAFDATIFQQFFAAHYDRAAEQICRGSTEVDLSATGWCR